MQSVRLAGQSVKRERLDNIKNALGKARETASTASLVQLAWKAAKLEGRPSVLRVPRPQECPFIGWHANQGWFVVTSQNADGSWLAQDSKGVAARLKNLAGVECVSLPTKAAGAANVPRASHLIWAAILQRKGIVLEALLATLLVNTLALVASIFSMQVYDRVIPNHGFQTLWVLSVGVVVALLLELVLKHVRSHAIERASTRIDAELSEWFFERALGVRLECRPPSIGTLAAQIKGFEMVRGIMSSTSIFMLIDVPFALFFIVVIGLIAPQLVIVPIVLLPISLISGLMFQRQIARNTKENQGQSNRKAGLLVESIDGAESLKANSAEWKLQARWNRLVAEAGESDYNIKQYSSLSQHVTVTLQQAGYVALVAFGAYLVTENSLTMGGLIACTIINGRAMAPIAQLPGLMVQWAHAGAAIDGLDKLISLPNELDETVTALTPESLEPSIRFEQARFSYGAAADAAVDINQLEIRPGDKVGIVGAIGSGKSTMLKLASGLYRPSEGKIFLGGIDMAGISPSFLRETIAYLPQEIRLISGTLRDNLLQGLPDPGDEALLQAARQTGLITLISSHPKGLALPITEGGRGISGGQRQLVGLTRMLLANPSVLVLDEPTASMDAVAEAKVVAMLHAKAAAGTTLLVATHKSALLPIVDRLMVMQGGRVAIDGPRDLVMAKLAPAQTPAPATRSRDDLATASA
ncbi:MAG: ATP-binding cassette domain-containing protein [Betaproteobacteria bacterium]|nr:ATP-binding cassette domain-containing protein [Betaproteobacteria bacterium]